MLVILWNRYLHIKKIIIDEINPDGKPIKIEKKICSDNSSVTVIVTVINVNIENIVNKSIIDLELIKK